VRAHAEGGDAVAEPELGDEEQPAMIRIIGQAPRSRASSAPTKTT